MLRFLKVMAWLMAALPLGCVMGWGRWLGAVFYAVAVKQRKRALTELRRCFPDLTNQQIRQMARRVFENMGLNFVEVFRWIGGKDKELMGRVALEGGEHMQEALRRGRGAAVLTAHLGNWDLMGLWAAAAGYPLTIISKDLRSKGLNQFWMEARKKWGVKIVPAHNSYRDCLRVLKNNGCLGFILDQNMTRAEGIFVDFFGKPACTTPGLAVLSAHAGAPVVPVSIVRTETGHRVKFLSPIEPPTDRKPETIAQATQMYTTIIEKMVREYPDQWIWMHRRWRTQPVAETEKKAEVSS